MIFSHRDAGLNPVPSACRFVSDMPKTVKTCGSSSGAGHLVERHMETDVRFIPHKQGSLKYAPIC